MIDESDLELKELVCKEMSSFALCVVDVESFEVIYSNNAMRNFMIDSTAKKCWESLYGFKSQCSWCYLKSIFNLDDIDLDETSEFEHEYFNEKTNKWYQIQSKVSKLKNGKYILISIALDITTQKEAQGGFITTQVKLVQQAKELKKTQEELMLLASIDPMTKLFNRRHFIEISESILDLASRNKTQASIIMLDIDKFKNVNDTYGHKVGDDVIIFLSSILQEQSRKSDIVSRWGGEEFLILLPNTNIDGAYVIAEKIRKVVENLIITLENNKELKFTVSIGISNVEHGMKIDTSIDRADKALYRAKQSGRNRVCE